MHFGKKMILLEEKFPSWRRDFLRFILFKMAQYTQEERVFMVKSYLETKSPDYVIDACRNQFLNRNVPSKFTIYRNVEKYSNEGTSLNLKREGQGGEKL